jgi:hypothetical protein
MGGPRQEPEIYENSQDSKGSSEDISQRQISQKITYFFAAVRISCIVAFAFWVLSALFKPDISEIIVVILVFLIFLSAVLDRYIKFYCKYTSLLGFITEMSFIFGFVFCVIGAIAGYSHSMKGFLAFSFMIAPGLGIMNRAIKLKRGETKKVYHAIIEMFIFAISVVVAIWFLLKIK